MTKPNNNNNNVPSKVNAHVNKPNNNNCKGYSEKEGEILKNGYGFEIPKAIIDDMRMGKCELPSGIASEVEIFELDRFSGNMKLTKHSIQKEKKRKQIEVEIIEI